MSGTSGPSAGSSPGGNDGTDILQSLSDQMTARGSLYAVVLFIGIFLALGALTFAVFILLRPRHKAIYAPKCNLTDLQGMAGTDATVFLYFLHMVRWCLTAISVLVCIILLPVDLSYNIAHNNDTNTNTNSDTGTSTTSKNYILYLTMSQVDGARLWAHVALSYIATLIALALIYIYYKKVIAIRQVFFTSAQYQRSYYSRTLMITDIPKEYQSDTGLKSALGSVKIPYPFSEVQVGHGMHDLPLLLKEQKKLVFHLETCLNRMLRGRRRVRPTIRLNGRLNNTFGGVKVDAIDHYAAELEAVERQIHEARSEKMQGPAMSYGFASLAAVAYAHTVAKTMSRARPLGMRIRLASSPRDILWANLMKSPGERARSKAFGLLFFFGLFIANLFPLLLVALISNMNAFAINGDFLEKWQSNSSLSFAAVEGILPPVISLLFALLLPILMQRLSMYRGVRTRESRDMTLCGQYFSFLVLTHFLFFSLISVFLDVAVFLIGTVRRHDNAEMILSKLWHVLLERIAIRFQDLSGYWMTWIILKGYMQLFELAQIFRIVLVWIHKHVAMRTPRELYAFARPPSFQYWVYYAELMFLAAIGLIYAPLAPVISAFVAAVFWMASFVYKYQFVFVYKTKSETGGRLWNVVVNRLLIIIGCMQIIIAIVIGINQSWIKAVSCIPPVLFVVAFRIYCRVKLEPQFLWYTPTAMDLAMTKVHVQDAAKQRLARQFGHPFLHDPLLVPIVFADVVDRAKEIFPGQVESSDVLRDMDSEKEANTEAIGLDVLHPPHDTWAATTTSQSDVLQTPPREARYGGWTAGDYANVPYGAYDEDDLHPPEKPYARASRRPSFSSELSGLSSAPPLRQDTFPRPNFSRQASDQSLRTLIDGYKPKATPSSVSGPGGDTATDAHGLLESVFVEEPEALEEPPRVLHSAALASSSTVDLTSYYVDDAQTLPDAQTNLHDTPYMNPVLPTQVASDTPPLYMPPSSGAGHPSSPMPRGSPKPRGRPLPQPPP
ncbi:hypothetical protein MBRA1_003519 [Malassezia brasiliensis]|uniref:DUF221-domain-containing protein n=1 Tax=Malassezia brasiliensis TaxID=1821822 RepID=A0AAF0IR90_9BASI|nr:hypothetical protein MBRA1_003519 [Malassezia brasiliensis]